MKILNLDDHPLFSSGLKASLLSSEHKFDVVVMEDAHCALSYLNQNHDVDLIVLDIAMPNMDGISFMRALLNRDIYVPVAIMSASENIQQLKQAFELGALGFLPKSLLPEELVNALLTIYQGNTFIPPKLKAALNNMTKFAEENTQTVLSNRQLEILTMVQQGHSNQNIANVLFISETTVKSHLQSIFKIIGAKNRVDCVQKSVELKILSTG
ncbi:response regulator transcription factor [Endozoicomonas sp. G2_1]|uniref:response regulator n=1 Tax=Endozoicomonas sp. G2_1 TaxID=2821091 RepID=UPI001ADC3224|nr:response regulator transcription factor [Endozoicomonas sp. G2_1]